MKGGEMARQSVGVGPQEMISRIGSKCLENAVDPAYQFAQSDRGGSR